MINVTVLTQETKEWNGLIGEVVSGRADVIAQPLTVNFGRSQVVDFCLPFYRDPFFFYIR